jgi:hypothetical protein
MSVFAIESLPTSRRKQNTGDPVCSRTLELSEYRTYDRALETLGAYKLTGNFPTELEIVLRDMRALTMLTFEIEPKSGRSDCRRVEFRPKSNIRQQQFDDIMRHIEIELGVTEPSNAFWTRLFG